MQSPQSLALVALPPDVICECVLPHLSIRDLQALDTAFTNKLHRPQLRGMWKSYRWSQLDMYYALDELMMLHKLGVKVIGTKTGKWSESEVFTSLTKLHLVGVDFGSNCDDDELARLAQYCPLLEVLHLSYGEYSYVGVIALVRNCNQLHTITLQSKHITDAGIQALCDNCPLLQHITLSYCSQLTDASLTNIANTYRELLTLHISTCKFSDDALIHCANQCHELRSVSVSSDEITNRGVTILWAANPNLVDVDTGLYIRTTDEEIKVLVQHHPFLRHVLLSCTSLMTDAAVSTVAEHCPQLLSINIRCCRIFSDAALVSIGQHCRNLKSINISHTMGLTDIGVAALAAGCSLLREFNASHTAISDTGLIALALNCGDLRTVNLGYCKSIGIVSISAIAENCLFLSELYVRYSDVDDACLYAVAQHCSNLTILDIQYTRCCETTVDAVLSSCRQLSKLIVSRGLLCDDKRKYVDRRYPHVLVGGTDRWDFTRYDEV